MQNSKKSAGIIQETMASDKKKDDKGTLLDETQLIDE
jgi:hypothetical protein